MQLYQVDMRESDATLASAGVGISPGYEQSWACAT